MPDPTSESASMPRPSAHASRSGGSFPARLAAIDVGSNAIRMLAAEFSDPRSYSVIARERGAVRLGRGAFAAGELDAAAMDAAVATLAGFRRGMDELGVERSRAVATSAVRESANGATFAERVRQDTGLELEVIDGDEEAALMRRAVSSRVALAGRRWVLVDVGGGSTELSHLDADRVVRSTSYPIGAVRLLEELPPAEEDLARFRRLLAERAAALSLRAEPREPRSTGMIAVGGNIEALARLAGHDAAGGVA
ncbi:MAG TPA: hypothetical protein VGR27_09595, partial [Longimicrobiaceae bacterium]|nr:hypothetical protein [Longimicrobiaceae bacterium]